MKANRKVHKESYLGDGAYIARDDYNGIVIAANDKVSGNPTDIVYLEDSCVKLLKQYLKDMEGKKYV